MKIGSHFYTYTHTQHTMYTFMYHHQGGWNYSCQQVTLLQTSEEGR